MTKFAPNEDSWPLYQAIGTWTVAIVLLVIEATTRHYQDTAALPFLGGLLGLPVVINADRARRERKRDGGNGSSHD